MARLGRFPLRRHSSLFVAAFVVLLGVGPPMAMANTASVSVSVGANPTQGVPVSLTVSRSNQVARSLYVYVNEDAAGCNATPEIQAEVGTTLASGTAIGPGSFSEQYSYTLPDAGANYVLCAYVDDSPADSPDAQNSATFTPGTPSAVGPPPKTPTNPSPTIPRAGSGTINTSGRVGPWRLDRSTRKDVLQWLGAPQTKGWGNLGVGDPDFDSLQYSCGGRCVSIRSSTPAPVGS